MKHIRCRPYVSMLVALLVCVFAGIGGIRAATPARPAPEATCPAPLEDDPASPSGASDAELKNGCPMFRAPRPTIAAKGAA